MNISHGALFACFLLVCILTSVTCLRDSDTVLPPDENLLRLSDFSTAQSCSTCHPQYYEEWEGSMHRYAANDPIWRLANNALQASTSGRLKSWCFQCHAPIGFLTGNRPPTFEFSDLPDLVREGVNCDFCHVMRGPFRTTDQHIRYTLDLSGKKYGTISDPIPTVHEHGYDPAYGRSEVCRPCHDLIINGVPTEMTFTEWQQSPWGAMGFECQRCHMTTYTGQAAVGGPIRDNLHRHDFIGVDVAITDFPDREGQRAKIDSLLKNSASLAVFAPAIVQRGDPVEIRVRVTNDKTGHNLPTSVFFFRQMWVEVTAWKNRDTVFISGHLDPNGDLMDRTSEYAPNRDTSLMLFSGILFKNHVETNVFELDSLVNNSLPPFASREAGYRFAFPSAGDWNLRVRLLFRPFGPYLYRALGADSFIGEIPTFVMNVDEKVIVAR